MEIANSSIASMIAVSVSLTNMIILLGILLMQSKIFKRLTEADENYKYLKSLAKDIVDAATAADVKLEDISETVKENSNPSNTSVYTTAKM